MTDREEIDTHRMPDGTEYRVLIERDPDPQEPYDDGGWPILRLEHRAYAGWVATAFNQQAAPYVEKFNALGEGGHPTEVFERYLRIFHGNTHVRWYGLNRATDYNYVAFDTKAWHEEMGFLPNNVEALAKEDPLAEIRAWIEGDVWGYALESRYDPDDKGTEWEDANESCGGFYGQKYAEEEARAILRGAVENHKVVHRYPESEKLVALETEVRACFELLEFMDGHEDNIRVVKTRPDGVTVTISQPNHQRLVYEAFGLDYDKIQEERELMLKRLQEEATQ